MLFGSRTNGKGILYRSTNKYKNKFFLSSIFFFKKGCKKKNDAFHSFQRTIGSW